MRKIFFLSLFVFSCLSISAQGRYDTPEEKEKFQAVYVEVGRGSLMYSLNYERRFSNKTGVPSLYAGAGLFANGDTRLFTVPVGLNFLFGKKSSFFELQVGATFWYNKDDDSKRTKTPFPSEYNRIYSDEDSFPFDRILDVDGQRVYGTFGVGYRWHPGDFLIKVGLSTIYGSDKYNKFLFFPFYPGVAFGYCF